MQSLGEVPEIRVPTCFEGFGAELPVQGLGEVLQGSGAEGSGADT